MSQIEFHEKEHIWKPRIHVLSQFIVSKIHCKLYFILVSVLSYHNHCFRTSCWLCADSNELLISHVSLDILCDIIQSYKVSK